MFKNSILPFRNWHKRFRQFLGLGACGGVLLPAILHAHDCGPPVVTLKLGESCSWAITADLQETSTLYTPQNLTGPAGVALITPFAPFYAKHGVFVFNGQSIGTNQFTVHWFYPGTGASSDCTVEIRVTSASTFTNAQSLFREGSLCTYQSGTIIRAKILRDALDHYIPAQAKKLLIFTQCYGGSMAQSIRFENMPNTAVLSATSPNQTAKYGGYDDDAARALSPGEGRTAREVHLAGSIGRKTLPPIHGAPPPSKINDLKGSEWPRTAGNLALTDFSLAGVSSVSPVRSRHIVVYAGKPEVKQIQMSLHDGATVPDREGTVTNQIADATYRDTIKNNFRDEPSTTFRSVGGPPHPGNPAQGQDGWDFPGSLEGLKKALAEAGEAIRTSPDPAAEQFILYVTDHGGKGWKAPEIFAPVMLPSTRTAAVRGMTINDPTLESSIDALQADPLNQCGFFLEFTGIEPPPGLNGANLLTDPILRPGDFILEIIPSNQPPILITGTQVQSVDLDDNGVIGNLPGEENQVFFPLPEARLIELLQSESLDINVDNRTPHTYQIEDLGFHTGAIAKPASMIPPPTILDIRRVNGSEVELMVKGIASFAYAVESSDNLAGWERGSPVTFLNDVAPLRHPAPQGKRFFRVVWVNQ